MRKKNTSEKKYNFPTFEIKYVQFLSWREKVTSRAKPSWKSFSSARTHHYYLAPMVLSEIVCNASFDQILRCEPKLNTHWFLIYLFKYLFCFIPKLSFKFIENITQCTEKLKRTFLAFQFRYLLIWHKNRRCDATCIFDECSDKELFFHRAAQNHLKVFKKKKIIRTTFAKKRIQSQ